MSKAQGVGLALIGKTLTQSKSLFFFYYVSNTFLPITISKFENSQESLTAAFIWVCFATVIKMVLEFMAMFYGGKWRHAHVASSAAMFVFMFLFVGGAYGATIWSIWGGRGSGGGAIRAFCDRLLVICTYVMAHTFIWLILLSMTLKHLPSSLPVEIFRYGSSGASGLIHLLTAKGAEKHQDQ